MKKYLILTVLFISQNFILAQQSIKYDKICYCSGNETPHSIISYDNNLEILLSLKDSLSIQEIEKINIAYTKSQLKLLQLFNLIGKQDNRYYTKVNILDTIQTKNLRRDTKRIATLIYPYLEDEILGFVQYLNEKYSTRNEFSILFSYILDGLIWDKFEEHGMINPNIDSDDILTWIGHFWMIPFPRDAKCGTNTISKKSTTIYITNGVPWRYLKPLYDNYELMDQMILNINDEGKIIDTDVIKTFKIYDIIDTSGEVKVPIINAHKQDKIFKLSDSVAQKIFNQLIESVSFSVLADRYKLTDNETALIIFYHELMWDLMSIIEQEGIVKRPEILIDSDNSNFEEMVDLIFFVKND